MQDANNLLQLLQTASQTLAKKKPPLIISATNGDRKTPSKIEPNNVSGTKSSHK